MAMVKAKESGSSMKKLIMEQVETELEEIRPVLELRKTTTEHHKIITNLELGDKKGYSDCFQTGDVITRVDVGKNIDDVIDPLGIICKAVRSGRIRIKRNRIKDPFQKLNNCRRFAGLPPLSVVDVDGRIVWVEPAESTENESYTIPIDQVENISILGDVKWHGKSWRPVRREDYYVLESLPLLKIQNDGIHVFTLEKNMVGNSSFPDNVSSEVDGKEKGNESASSLNHLKSKPMHSKISSPTPTDISFDTTNQIETESSASKPKQECSRTPPKDDMDTDKPFKFTRTKYLKDDPYEEEIINRQTVLQDANNRRRSMSQPLLSVLIVPGDSLCIEPLDCVTDKSYTITFDQQFKLSPAGEFKWHGITWKPLTSRGYELLQSWIERGKEKVLRKSITSLNALSENPFGKIESSTPKSFPSIVDLPPMSFPPINQTFLSEPKKKLSDSCNVLDKSNVDLGKNKNEDVDPLEKKSDGEQSDGALTKRIPRNRWGFDRHNYCRRFAGLPPLSVIDVHGEKVWVEPVETTEDETYTIPINQVKEISISGKVFWQGTSWRPVRDSDYDVLESLPLNKKQDDDTRYVLGPEITNDGCSFFSDNENLMVDGEEKGCEYISKNLRDPKSKPELQKNSPSPTPMNTIDTTHIIETEIFASQSQQKLCENVPLANFSDSPSSKTQSNEIPLKAIEDSNKPIKFIRDKYFGKIIHYGIIKINRSIAVQEANERRKNLSLPLLSIVEGSPGSLCVEPLGCVSDRSYIIPFDQVEEPSPSGEFKWHGITWKPLTSRGYEILKLLIERQKEKTVRKSMKRLSKKPPGKIQSSAPMSFPPIHQNRVLNNLNPLTLLNFFQKSGAPSSVLPIRPYGFHPDPRLRVQSTFCPLDPQRIPVEGAAQCSGGIDLNDAESEIRKKRMRTSDIQSCDFVSHCALEDSKSRQSFHGLQLMENNGMSPPLASERHSEELVLQSSSNSNYARNPEPNVDEKRKRQNTVSLKRQFPTSLATKEPDQNRPGQYTTYAESEVYNKTKFRSFQSPQNDHRSIISSNSRHMDSTDHCIMSRNIGKANSSRYEFLRSIGINPNSTPEASSSRSLGPKDVSSSMSFQQKSYPSFRPTGHQVHFPPPPGRENYDCAQFGQPQSQQSDGLKVFVKKRSNTRWTDIEVQTLKNSLLQETLKVIERGDDKAIDFVHSELTEDSFSYCFTCFQKDDVATFLELFSSIIEQNEWEIITYFNKPIIYGNVNNLTIPKDAFIKSLAFFNKRHSMLHFNEWNLKQFYCKENMTYFEVEVPDEDGQALEKIGWLTISFDQHKIGVKKACRY